MLTFWKVTHCNSGSGRVRTTKHKQQQQQAATGTPATRNSNKQNQEQHKQHKQQPWTSQGQEVWVPNVGVEASSRGFSVVFEADFLDTIKICNNWSLTSSEVYWEKINGKIVLDILQKPPEFHTTAREPKPAQLAPTLQTPPTFHEKNPKRGRKENSGGIRKKTRNFGRSGGRNPEGWCPEGWVAQNFALFSTIFIVWLKPRTLKCARLECSGCCQPTNPHNNSTKYLLLASMSTNLKKKWNLLENCQIHALKLFWNVYTKHELEDLIFNGQWTKLHDRLRNGPKLVTNARIDWYLTFIPHVNTNSIVLCKIVQTGIVSRLWFRRRYWRFEIHFLKKIVHFWKSHICSQKSDVQGIDCRFVQFNRIWNYLCGHWIEIGRAACWSYGIWLFLF